MNNTEISYDPHLIITQIRPGFHIYIYLKGPYTFFYTISPWSNIILVVLQDNYFDFGYLIQHALFSIGFYMSSLQELCAYWVMSDAPGRSALGSPRTYHARIPWQQTMSHPNVAQRYRANINDKVFPRELYAMECHKCWQFYDWSPWSRSF